MENVLYLVVPCYNEEAVLLQSNTILCNKMNELIASGLISKRSKIMYVDDGSVDATWDIIKSFYEQDDRIQGLKLSRNKGHQMALMAGLMYAKKSADIVISLDADLQDDVNVINQFIEEYKKGAEIVYGVRNSRKTDSFLKRNTAIAFYRLMDKLGVESVYNHADYRLMSKRALDALEDFPEVNLFLRGVVPLIGFQTACVKYDRGERLAGESKYPLKKMISFAIEGVTSCSVKPIHIITMLGIGISFFAFLLLCYAVIGHATGGTVSGWTSLLVAILFLGGFQIIGIGVIGEYIGKIYLEVKKRPRYIVDEYLHNLESEIDEKDGEKTNE